MADRYTQELDVLTPQRIGEVVNDLIYDELAILESQAVTDLNATFINGGNQVTFPVFEGVQGSFSDLDTTDSTGSHPEIVYSKMNSETADVVSKIIDVGIRGTTLEDAFRNKQFNIVDGTLEDVGLKAASMVDGYLVTTAAGTSLTYTIPASGTMNRTGVIKAKTTKWGDMSRIPAIFLCHSKVFGDIQDEVKDVYNIGLNQGVNQGGTVQLYHGMPVYVSDACPVSGTDYSSFVLGLGAIGFDFHRELSYKVLPQLGDQNVHEFVVRYIAKLRRRKGKDLAIEIVSK